MNIIKIRGFLFFVLVWGSFSAAQAQEGSCMIYGSLTYKDSNTSGSSFGANPIGLGYFFNDHVVAGMNFAFNKEKNGFGSRTVSNYEVGPFYSDSWKIGEYFVLIAQLDAHYVWGEALMNTINAYGYDGYLARVYPIVAVTLGNGWALKAKFCELSYTQTVGQDSNRTRNKTFIAGVNGSTFGLGVSKNISFKKNIE